MRPVVLPFLLLAGTALLAGDPTRDLPRLQGGDLQKYWGDVCARCHGVAGNGRDNGGRPLPDQGFDFTDSRKANRRKDSDWVNIILAGREKMPAFKDRLTPDNAQRMTVILRKFSAKS